MDKEGLYSVGDTDLKMLEVGLLASHYHLAIVVSIIFSWDK